MIIDEYTRNKQGYWIVFI